jgi:hypothetical protein
MTLICLEGLDQFAKSSDLTGNQTLDLVACSTVPQLFYNALHICWNEVRKNMAT